MRWLTLLLPVALTATLFATGCGKDAPPKATGERVREADKKRDEAVEDTRAEYVREAGVRLKAFDERLKKMGDEIASATGQAKADLEARYAATKGKREAAAEKLRELKEASADRWEKVKDASTNAFDELKKAFD